LVVNVFLVSVRSIAMYIRIETSEIVCHVSCHSEDRKPVKYSQETVYFVCFESVAIAEDGSIAIMLLTNYSEPLVA
jgi:hypothetical protein